MALRRVIPGGEWNGTTYILLESNLLQTRRQCEGWLYGLLISFLCSLNRIDPTDELQFRPRTERIDLVVAQDTLEQPSL